MLSHDPLHPHTAHVHSTPGCEVRLTLSLFGHGWHPDLLKTPTQHDQTGQQITGVLKIKHVKGTGQGWYSPMGHTAQWGRQGCGRLGPWLRAKWAGKDEAESLSAKENKSPKESSD